MGRKITAVSLILVALVIGIIAFRYGTIYERQVELGIDVGTYSMHINIYVQRAGSDEIEVIKDGVLLDNSGVLTTIGLNWIEDQLGDSPSTDPAKWISVSTDPGSPSAAWTQIPTEIASGGLTRTAGTYTSTGDGVWTISNQFTASATHTDIQLTGLQYAVSGDNNLMASDTFTIVTLNNGDKLTVTWTNTVS